jgi:hypothetical protein
MANMLHGSARTTPRIRAGFPKLERKDQHPGPAVWAEPHDRYEVAIPHHDCRCAHGSDEAQKHSAFSCRASGSIVEFQRRTLLPLDDVMGCLRESIPKLTSSSLHRCLQRHGISRLPASEIKTTGKGKFAPTLIGYVHIDIAKLRLTQGKLNMFLAIDRISKFTYFEFRDDLGKMNGADLLSAA